MTALDRETMTSQITLGVDTPAISAIHRSIAWAQSPDVDLTQALCVRSGARQPDARCGRFPTRLRRQPDSRSASISKSAGPNFDAISQFVQQQWKAIGVPVQLMPLDRTVMQDMVFVKRDFDINLKSRIGAGIQRSESPAFTRARRFEPVPSTNGAGYCNPTWTTCLPKAPSRATPASRAPSYAPMVKILADDLPYSVVDRSPGPLRGEPQVRAQKHVLERRADLRPDVRGVHEVTPARYAPRGQVHPLVDPRPRRDRRDLPRRAAACRAIR